MHKSLDTHSSTRLYPKLCIIRLYFQFGQQSKVRGQIISNLAINDVILKSMQKNSTKRIIVIGMESTSNQQNLNFYRDLSVFQFFAKEKTFVLLWKFKLNFSERRIE